jgi:hypothetical protein
MEPITIAMIIAAAARLGLPFRKKKSTNSENDTSCNMISNVGSHVKTEDKDSKVVQTNNAACQREANICSNNIKKE